MVRASDLKAGMVLPLEKNLSKIFHVEYHLGGGKMGSRSMDPFRQGVLFSTGGGKIGRRNLTMKFSFFLILSVCLGFVGAPGPAGGGQRTETARLIVEDVKGQLSPEQFQRFATAAEAALQKAIQFWAIPDRTAEGGKIRLELHPEHQGRAFAVFQLEKNGSGRQKVVRLYGLESPEELVHKLTHALFPTEDKFVRNMMGVPTEERFGNPLSFPMCGRSLDAWVMALRQTGSYIPLRELGEDHETWGMTFQGQMPVVSDRKRQHASYLEAGSFGDFLLKGQGVEKIKAFYRASLQSERPWAKIFGQDLAGLESQWLGVLEKYGPENQDQARSLAKLWLEDPKGACYETQGSKPPMKTPGQPKKKSR